MKQKGFKPPDSVAPIPFRFCWKGSAPSDTMLGVVPFSQLGAPGVSSMRLAVSLIVLGVASVAMAEDARPVPAAVGATIDRGLGFLVNDALAWIERFKPKRAVITNMHADLDYEVLRQSLPDGVIPAYDGMRLQIG